MLKAISKPITYSLENIKTIDKQWGLSFHHINYFSGCRSFQRFYREHDFRSGSIVGSTFITKKDDKSYDS